MEQDEYDAIRAMLAGLGEAAEPIGEAMAVYGVKGDLKDPDFLQTATQISWRYLLVEGTKCKYLDVSLDKKSFHSLSQPFTSALEDGLASARRQGFFRNPCSVRILEIPTLKLATLWVHETGRNEFLPYMKGLAPTPVAVDPDFTRLVNREAIKMEQMYRGKGPTLGG